MRYRVGEYRGAAVAGTREHFLIERYLLHVQRGFTLWTVAVRHQPYPLHAVELLNLDENLVRRAGISPSGPPALVHFASGVDVHIRLPRLRL